MTFADLDVVAALNESFICCWVDLGRGSLDAPLPDFPAEQMEQYADGGGGRTLGTFLALPDGRLVHEVRGWMKPKEFLAEAAFARGLTAENVVEKRSGRPALASLLSPVSDAVRGARSWGVT